jgi:hypothetical protein
MIFFDIPPPAQSTMPVYCCAYNASIAYIELPAWAREELFRNFSDLISLLGEMNAVECEKATSGTALHYEIRVDKKILPRNERNGPRMVLSKNTKVLVGRIAERPNASQSGVHGLHYFSTDEEKTYVAIDVDGTPKWVPAEKLTIVLKGLAEDSLEIWGRVPSLEPARSVPELRRISLLDHASRLRLARADLMSVDTIARIDACMAIDAALALVPKHGAELVGTERLAPQAIARSVVGEVAQQMAALLDYMPKRSWFELTSAMTSWTVAIGKVLAETGLVENPAREPVIKEEYDWLDHDPIFDRDSWRRVGT